MHYDRDETVRRLQRRQRRLMAAMWVTLAALIVALAGAGWLAWHGHI